MVTSPVFTTSQSAKRNENQSTQNAIAPMLTSAQNIVTPSIPFQKTLTMEKCKHELTRIKVLKVTATCETTVIICAHCKKELETPKTEC